jgi:hypothetical protein
MSYTCRCQSHTVTSTDRHTQAQQLSLSDRQVAAAVSAGSSRRARRSHADLASHHRPGTAPRLTMRATHTPVHSLVRLCARRDSPPRRCRTPTPPAPPRSALPARRPPRRLGSSPWPAAHRPARSSPRSGRAIGTCLATCFALSRVVRSGVQWEGCSVASVYGSRRCIHVGLYMSVSMYVCVCVYVFKRIQKGPRALPACGASHLQLPCRSGSRAGWPSRGGWRRLLRLLAPAPQPAGERDESEARVAVAGAGILRWGQRYG